MSKVLLRIQCISRKGGGGAARADFVAGNLVDAMVAAMSTVDGHVLTAFRQCKHPVHFVDIQYVFFPDEEAASLVNAWISAVSEVTGIVGVLDEPAPIVPADTLKLERIRAEAIRRLEAEGKLPTVPEIGSQEGTSNGKTSQE